jgi:hypothetical protein
MAHPRPVSSAARAGDLGWVLVVVLLVLLVLLALVVRAGGGAALLAASLGASRDAEQPVATGGYQRNAPQDGDSLTVADITSSGTSGGDGIAQPAPVAIKERHHGHEVMHCVLQSKAEQTIGFRPGRLGITGGAGTGANASAGAWTTYKTWKDLAGTPAYRQYWQERTEVLKNYPTEWGRVREQLKAALSDSREWAGSINITGAGRSPSVVSKIPSPFAVGEAVEHGASAVIPADVVAKASETPAMFFFHTHPTATSPLISSIDASAAVLGCYLGHHAAHLVVSPDAIIMYGLLPATLARIWGDPNPHVAAERKSYDVYSAVEGLRSYGAYYSARDLAGIMERMGLLYVVYPLDSFVRVAYSNVFIPQQSVNTDEARRQLARVEAAQAGAGNPRRAASDQRRPASDSQSRAENLPQVAASAAGD